MTPRDRADRRRQRLSCAYVPGRHVLCVTAERPVKTTGHAGDLGLSRTRNRHGARWPDSNVGGLSYGAPCEEGTMSTRTDLEEWAAARVHGICLKTGPPRKVG